MSQDSVLKFLMKHPREQFTAREVSDLIKLGFGTVSINLRKLARTKFINCIYTLRPRVYWYQK